MGTLRSQRHSREIHGRDSGGWTPGPQRVKPLYGILPDTPSAPRLGPVPRVVIVLSALGGLAPFEWTLLNNAGLMLVTQLGTNFIVSSADPVGPPGDYDLIVGVVDVLGGTLNETVRLTLW